MQKITREVRPGELVFVFSLSGLTEELVKAAENASSLGAHIICCTCGPADTPLARLAHITVFGYKHQHAAALGLNLPMHLQRYNNQRHRHRPAENHQGKMPSPLPGAF